MLFHCFFWLLAWGKRIIMVKNIAHCVLHLVETMSIVIHTSKLPDFLHAFCTASNKLNLLVLIPVHMHANIIGRKKQSLIELQILGGLMLVDRWG